MSFNRYLPNTTVLKRRDNEVVNDGNGDDGGERGDKEVKDNGVGKGSTMVAKSRNESDHANDNKGRGRGRKKKRNQRDFATTQRSIGVGNQKSSRQRQGPQQQHQQLKSKPTNTSSSSISTTTQEERHKRRQHGQSMLGERGFARQRHLKGILEKAVKAHKRSGGKEHIVAECRVMCTELECLSRLQHGITNSSGGVWVFEMARERLSIAHKDKGDASEKERSDIYQPSAQQKEYEGLVFDTRRAMKAYRREAADARPQLPFEIRPPDVLLHCMTFLASNVMNVSLSTFSNMRFGREGVQRSSGISPQSASVHPSSMISPEHHSSTVLRTATHVRIWHEYLVDRLRAIRKDIRVQHIATVQHCVEACKVIVMQARFHVLAQYIVGGCVAGLWLDNSMNMKFLRDVFDVASLIRNAYNQLHPCSDSDKVAGEMKLMFEELQEIELLIRSLQGHYNPKELLHVRTKPVCDFIVCVTDQSFLNYSKAFRLLRNSFSFLHLCVVAPFLNSLRHRALNTMRAACGRQRVPLQTITNQLGFDDAPAAQEWLMDTYIRGTQADGKPSHAHSQSSPFQIVAGTEGEDAVVMFNKGVKLEVLKEKRLSLGLAWPQRWMMEGRVNDTDSVGGLMLVVVPSDQSQETPDVIEAADKMELLSMQS
eukprot:m.26094 g.26094  ORF g.26094 m.26094 type:complete len:653 (+) comp9238_c1_seq1:33-1991(+)